ncbi:MAG: hypothetical protein F4Z34_07775 [Acidimicrobiaceae bacterium]|nr:hypothetical protein [Acidimicrobiaceae bacterium]
MKVPELLDLLDRMEEAAIGGDVVEALLLCQKLGGDADSAGLQDWAKHELGGYPQEVTPPEYRRVAALLFGNGAFLGGKPVTGHPIPMDVLPKPEKEELGRGILLSMPVSQIQTIAKKETAEWRPSHSARIIDAVNAANKASMSYDDIYFGMPGHGCAAVIVAVRSRIVSLVTLLRRSIPSDAQPDQVSVKAAVLEAVTAPTVNILGSNNALVVGDGSTARVSALDGDTSLKPSRKVWRWLKRILEAVTGIGTVMGILWDGSGSPL